MINEEINVLIFMPNNLFFSFFKTNSHTQNGFLQSGAQPDY